MHRAARTLCTAVSTVRPALALSTLALVGACAGRPAADTGLNTDLALADQVQRRNAPVLVAGSEVAPAAAPDSSSTPARVATPARSGGRSSRVVAPARAAAPTVTATSPAPANHTAPAQAGTYDAGHVAGGEVASGGPSAPADQSAAPVAGRSSAGQYGTEIPVERPPQAHTARAGGALGAVYGHSVDRTYPGYGYGSPTYGYRASPGYRRATAYRTF